MWHECGTTEINSKLWSRNRSKLYSLEYLGSGKVEVVPVHFMKAHRGSGSIAPLIINLSNRWT